MLMIHINHGMTRKKRKMGKKEIIENLKLSANKIEKILSINNRSVFENITITIDDVEYSESQNKLSYVLFLIEIYLETDDSLVDISKSLQNINDNLSKFLNIVSLTNEGKLKTLSTGGVLHYGDEALLISIYYRHNELGDSDFNVKLHVAFHS
jgi:hypothetical protein